MLLAKAGEAMAQEAIDKLMKITVLSIASSDGKAVVRLQIESPLLKSGVPEVWPLHPRDSITYEPETLGGLTIERVK